MKFTIRDLTTYQDMLLVHQLQREIWGMDDPMFALYPPLMNTAAKNGGVVLGAFEANTDHLVGFLFGFLGREPGGPLKLCSQVMGVKAEWRQLGIAEALKQTQRRRVIAQELPLITWTYDPLEGPNAHLNLHKLRAISRTYWRDVYGPNLGKLNAGLPTDRLLVEWWVRGPRQSNPAEASAAEAAPVFEVSGQGLERRVVAADLGLTAPLLQLESVANLPALKKADVALALDWRLHLRAAFETYFAQGYLATDFISTINPHTGQRYNRYLLQQATPHLLAHIGLQPPPETQP